MLRLASFAAMVATPTQQLGTRDQNQPRDQDLPQDARSFRRSAGFSKELSCWLLQLQTAT